MTKAKNNNEKVWFPKATCYLKRHNIKFVAGKIWLQCKTCEEQDNAANTK